MANTGLRSENTQVRIQQRTVVFIAMATAICSLGHRLRLTAVFRWTQLCIPWSEGGNVTSAGWQITLCDSIWHVRFRSGEVGLLTEGEPLYRVYAFTYYFVSPFTFIWVEIFSRFAVFVLGVNVQYIRGFATPKYCATSCNKSAKLVDRPIVRQSLAVFLTVAKPSLVRLRLTTKRWPAEHDHLAG